MKEKKTFQTGDIWTGAYLRSHNYRLISTIFNGNNLIWVFEDDGTIENALSDFINDVSKAKVSPKKFISAYRDLKALIYSRKEK